MGTSSSQFIVLLCVMFMFCSCTKDASLSCIEKERQALLDFKRSLTDPSNRLSSWVGQDCCKWFGIQCNNHTGHVIKLDLRNPHPWNRTSYYGNNKFDPVYAKSCLVGGEVNHSLLDLNHLQHLDLSCNNFSGAPIPRFFGSFPKLRYLNLSSSHFSGDVPHHLGNLSSLYSLDIGSSAYFYDDVILSVDNLHWVSKLSHLHYLDMSEVDLSQTSNSLHALNYLPHLVELRLVDCGLVQTPLPFSFANLTSLTVLDLTYNSFGAPLPFFFENMTSLETLLLPGCDFNGTIRIDLSQLCNLKVLDLSGNNLVGDTFQLFQNISSHCFKSNKLEKLDLNSNDLTGHLPNWLGQLKNLKHLDLGSNYLTGPISPENLKQLTHLESLTMSLNNLSGLLPDSFGQLKNLRDVDLSSNQLNGTVPDSLGQLSRLENLNLGSNSLEGVMSDVHFSKLSNLKSLDLSYNSLSLKARYDWVPPFQLQTINFKWCLLRRIPMWLQTQKEFTLLDMFNSSIKDSLPEWFFNFSSHLSSSVTVDLGLNQIYGKVPNIFTSKFVGEIILHLEQNKFQGQFPNFPCNLVYLNLDENSISGPIPQEIGVMAPQLQYLILSNNSINGSIPRSLCKLKDLFVLDLSMNKLFGSVPKCWGDLVNVSYVYLSSNNLSGTIPNLVGNRKLSALDLSSNNLSGTIPNFFGTRKFLSIDLSSNNLTGTIPNLSGNVHLSILDLSSNNLSGNIPESIGNLVQLEWLHLSRNQFCGQIPRSLKNCTKLTMLDLGKNKLSGDIFPWLGKNLPNLKFVTLRSNKLSGTIPLQLCRLANCQVLDLAQNNISGSIPHCFGNFSSMKGKKIEDTRWYDLVGTNEIDVVTKGMEYKYTKTLPLLTTLDLSSNNLVGSIPEELMTLDALLFMNLSKNRLQGRIPENIGQMVSLESLDLSENHLSGKIPLSMSTLDFLGKLNLACNNLSGRIPHGNHLQTLGDSSIYSMNPQLCGAPLEKKCPEDKLPLPPINVKDMPKNVKQEFERTWFYIGMASGHIVGFWGVCGVLFFNKSCRIAYFKFLRNLNDRLLVQVAVNVAQLKRKIKKDGA